MPSRSCDAQNLASDLASRVSDALCDGQYAQAELMLREADEERQSPWSAIAVGELLAAWGRSEEAERFLRDAWERAKGRRVDADSSCGDVVADSGEMDACLALARFYRDRKDWVAAEQFEQLAICRSLQRGDSLDVQVQRSIVAGSLLKGDTAMARSVAEGMLAADAEDADAESLVGAINLVEGDNESAGRHFYSAYRRHRKLGDVAAAGADLQMTGKALRQADRFREALVCYRGAEALLEQSGDVDAAAEAKRAAAECRRVAVAAETVPGWN